MALLSGQDLALWLSLIAVGLRARPPLGRLGQAGSSSETEISTGIAIRLGPHTAVGPAVQWQPGEAESREGGVGPHSEHAGGNGFQITL